MIEVIYKAFCAELIKSASTGKAMRRGALVGGALAAGGLAIHEAAPHVHDALSHIYGGLKGVGSAVRDTVVGGGHGAGAAEGTEVAKESLLSAKQKMAAKVVGAGATAGAAHAGYKAKKNKTQRLADTITKARKKIEKEAEYSPTSSNHNKRRMMGMAAGAALGAGVTPALPVIGMAGGAWAGKKLVDKNTDKDKIMIESIADAIKKFKSADKDVPEEKPLSEKLKGAARTVGKKSKAVAKYIGDKRSKKS